MTKLKQLFTSSVCVAGLLVLTSGFAMEVEGTEKVTIPSSKSAQALPGGLLEKSKPITINLLKIKLSDKEMAVLQNEAVSAEKNETAKLLRNEQPVLKLSSRSEIDMRGFPVLNQGEYGTCATFAITGAFNYAMNRPDHVSQLCSLALGSYLSKNVKEGQWYPSGWNGSTLTIVLGQFAYAGYVSKADQQAHGCPASDLMEYPIKARSDNIEDHPMTLSAYGNFSHPISDFGIYSKTIVGIQERFGEDGAGGFQANRAVENIKKVLSSPQTNKEKSVVTVGILLYNICSAGACGKKAVTNDTWIVTQSIKNKLKSGSKPGSGHAMIIIGYDDEAIAVDRDGVEHKGLFKLRNSWSKDAGDEGNYYMSYDYFKQLVFQAEEVGSVDKNN